MGEPLALFILHSAQHSSERPLFLRALKLEAPRTRRLEAVEGGRKLLRMSYSKPAISEVGEAVRSLYLAYFRNPCRDPRPRRVLDWSLV